MKLPEPDWFTIQDLSRRWNVDESYIERLLESRKLKGGYHEYVDVSLPFEVSPETIPAGRLLTLIDMNVPEKWYRGSTFTFTVPPGAIIVPLEEVLRIEKESKASVNACQENLKSTESILKIIITMAIDGYGYDPNQTKSPTATEIQKASERLGISIDVDTVRKWLKKSVDFLPREGKDID